MLTFKEFNTSPCYLPSEITLRKGLPHTFIDISKQKCLISLHTREITIGRSLKDECK